MFLHFQYPIVHVISTPTQVFINYGRHVMYSPTFPLRARKGYLGISPASIVQINGTGASIAGPGGIRLSFAFPF